MKTEVALGIAVGFIALAGCGSQVSGADGSAGASSSAGGTSVSDGGAAAAPTMGGTHAGSGNNGVAGAGGAIAHAAAGGDSASAGAAGAANAAGAAGAVSTAGAAGAAGAADWEDAPACVVTAFAKSCNSAGCHAPNTEGITDLASPGLAARLVDQPEIFAKVDRADCPPSAKLIDTSKRDASWLLVKLMGLQGNCGVAMPEPGIFSAADMACVKNWVDQVPAPR